MQQWYWEWVCKNECIKPCGHHINQWSKLISLKISSRDSVFVKKISFATFISGRTASHHIIITRENSDSK